MSLVTHLQSVVASEARRSAVVAAEVERLSEFSENCKESEQTPLQVAAEEGRVGVVDFLVRIGLQGKDKDAFGVEVAKALRFAAGAGHLDVCKLLHSSCSMFLPTATWDDRGNPLEAAAEAGYEDVTNYLLQTGCYGPKPSPSHQTLPRFPLHVVATDKDERAARLHANTGHTPSQPRTNNYWEPGYSLAPLSDNVQRALVTAVEKDDVEAVKDLLQKVEEPMKLANSGEQAHKPHNVRDQLLKYAVREVALDTIRYLAETGADIHCRTETESGSTMLHLAAKSQKPCATTVVQLLLDSGVDIHAREILPDFDNWAIWYNPGYTALHNAAAAANADVFELLLAAGCDPFVTAHDGSTCLHAAAADGSTLIPERLLDMGLDPSQESGADSKFPWATPLELALHGGYLELTKLLLSRGATMPTMKLLSLATGTPTQWPNRHIELATVLIPHVNFVSISQPTTLSGGSISQDHGINTYRHTQPARKKPRHGDFYGCLRDLISFAFSKKILQMHSCTSSTAISPSVALLRQVLECCPPAVDDATMMAILKQAACDDDYSLIDAVMECLPHDMSQRVAADLSNKLGPDPRRTRAALYLAQRYGGPGALSHGQQRSHELKLTPWRTPTASSVLYGYRPPKDEVDMNSNTLWDSPVTITERIWHRRLNRS